MSKQAYKVDPCPVKTPFLLMQLSTFFTEKKIYLIIQNVETLISIYIRL